MDFCTYFDSAYATKAKVCHHTLTSNSSVRLFVLCMDDVVAGLVSKWRGVIPIMLKDIEEYRPSLLNIKGSRQPKEYYATITPILPQFLFDKFGLDTVFYTDADMAFFSSVDEISSEMGSNSLLVTPHENPIAMAGGAGFFNVGILGYRKSPDGISFLKWWEERCLEWCEWRALPDGRCADQGYLSIIHNNPNRFSGVKVSTHPGINLGPWNLSMHPTSFSNGKIVLDCRHNLICYHFHGYKDIVGKCVNDTGWEVSPWNMSNIYEPYHNMMLLAKKGTLA